MNYWTLDKQSQTPLYLQLYHQLRELILQGEFASHRLPPGRELARRLGVARITVTQAYEQLEAEGFVRRRRGAGTFVAPYLFTHVEEAAAARPFQPNYSSWGQRMLQTAVPPTNKQPRPEIDFGFGRSFPHIFPYDIWRKLLARYLSTDDAMIDPHRCDALSLWLRGRFLSAAGSAGQLSNALARRHLPARAGRDCEWGAAGVGYFSPAAAGTRG